MKLRLYYFLFLLLCSIPFVGQEIEWEFTPYTGEFDLYDSTSKTLVDSEGNIYVIGHFEDVAYINEDTLTANVLNNNDILIVKYRFDRSFEWYKEINLGTYARNFEVAFDASENLIIVGPYSGASIQLDEYSLELTIEDTAFITKINSQGEVQWLRSVIGGAPFIHSMKFDELGNIYLAGIGRGNGFFVALDEKGNVQWRKNIEEYNVWGADIQKAPDGTVYALLMWNTDRIIINEGVTLYSPYEWGVQMTLFKFDEAGNMIWYEQNKQGRFLDDAYLSVDNESNVYVAGGFNNAPLELGDFTLPKPDFNGSRGFLAKCNGDKEWQWLIQRGTEPNTAKNMFFDCHSEYLYALGTSDLDVFDKEGNLIANRFFEDTFPYPTLFHFISLGVNDNILLSGLTFLGSIEDEDNFGDVVHPFIASFKYEWSVERIPAGPITDNTVYYCSTEEPILLSAEGENLSWYVETDLDLVISSSETIEVNNPVDSMVFYVSQTLEGCEGKRSRIELINLNILSLELTDDTLYAFDNDLFNYIWLLGGEIILEENKHSLPLVSEGLYTLIIETDDCSISIDYLFDPTDIHDIRASQKFDFYPTLFSNSVHLEVEIDNHDVQVEIFDAMGKSVKKQRVRSKSKEGFDLDTSDLKEGVYIFAVYTSYSYYTKKLIKL